MADFKARVGDTGWSPGFDVDPDISRQTRHKILDQQASEGSLVSSGRFPDPGFGRIVQKSGGRVWQGI